MEIVLRAQTDLPFLAVGFLHAALFAVVTALVVHLLASFFVGWARAVVVGTCLALTTLLFVSQFLYHDIFGTYYSVFSAGNAGQVAQFSDDVLGRARDNAAWLLLLAAPLLVFLLVRTSRRQPRVPWRHRAITAGCALALFAASLAGISLGDRGQNSAYDMYHRDYHPLISVDRLGLVTSMRLDLQRTLLGFERQLAPSPVVAAVRGG